MRGDVVPVSVPPVGPRLRRDLVHRRIDDDLLLYDASSHCSVLLNLSATAVVERCDGTRSPEQIADELRAVFAGGGRDLLAGVLDVLREVREHGMLEPRAAEEVAR